MARKIISIICYIIAGFFLYAVCMIAFASVPQYFMKIAIMCGFSIPGLIALVIGLAIRRFRTWKRDVGIVFLTASLFTTLIVFTMLCLFLSPEFKKFLPHNETDFSNDYITGSSCVIIFIFIGVLLIKKSKNTSLTN